MSRPRNVAVVLAGGVGSRVGLDIPKQAHQDRRAADHRAHHRDPAGQPAGRRDCRDDDAGLPRRGARRGAPRRVRQGHEGARGRRHPQRHHRASARRPRRGRVQRALPRRGAPAAQPAHRRRLRRRARAVRRRRHRHPVGRHDHPGRRGRRAGDDRRRAAALAAAARADPAGVPAVGDPARLRVASADPDFVATDDCTVVLRYLPDVPIAVVAGDERNMKVTEPIDVYLADKALPGDQPGPARAAHRRRVPRRA
nr:hypothetical protein [Angustibacter aerolatus]